MFAFQHGAHVAVCSKASSVPNGVDFIEVTEVPSSAYRNAWRINGDVVDLDPAKVLEIDTKVEKAWVQEELDSADITLNKVQDGHGRRPAGNEAQWRKYRNALRDHVIGDVIQGPRPTRPGA